jgi:hypothetical protein
VYSVRLSSCASSGEIARLDHLVGYGLAIKDNSHEYILQDGWDTILREMGERGDIIKTLHNEIKADPTKYRIYDKDASKCFYYVITFLNP